MNYIILSSLDTLQNLCKKYHVNSNIHTCTIFLSAGMIDFKVTDLYNQLRDPLEDEDLRFILRLSKEGRLYLSSEYYMSHMDPNNICVLHIMKGGDMYEDTLVRYPSKLTMYIPGILSFYRQKFDVVDTLRKSINNIHVYDEELVKGNYKIREIPDYMYLGSQYETETSVELINFLNNKYYGN